ncbi:MAG: FliH/SctL family protein [Halioglobus sp.]
MSDPSDKVEVWEAPFFEQPVREGEHLPLAELEAAAEQRGFETGQAAGMAQGLSEAQQIVSRLNSLAQEMATPYQNLDSVVTKELADVAMHLAQQIVRRELTIDSATVVETVEQAIATLYKLDGEIVIFLNPADAALMQGYSPETLDGKTWKIIEDESMSVGGCQVKTPSSFVDASIEKQLETLFETLLVSPAHEADQ